MKSAIRSTVLSAVQRAIFCECGSILDIDESVLISQRTGSGPCAVVCGPCFASLVDRVPSGVWNGLDAWHGRGKVLHPDRDKGAE